jgi:hypothetical protein
MDKIHFIDSSTFLSSLTYAMASWDDDDYEITPTKAPVIVSKGKWDGEDEDDEEIPVPPTLQNILTYGG